MNVVVGPNGSGKSNILDAICFLHDCADEDIDTAISKRHGIDSIRQWSRTRPYHITFELTFKRGAEYGGYRVVIASNRGNYRVLEESGHWFGVNPLRTALSDNVPLQSTFRRREDGEVHINNPFPNTKDMRPLSIGQEELFLTSLGIRSVRNASAFAFSPIHQELSSFSKYNIYPNVLRNPQSVSKESVLREDGSNLASILKRFSGNKRLASLKDDILSGLRSIMPNVIDFQIKSAGGFYVPVLRVREDNEDVHDFNLSQISDGTLRTLGLLTAFYQPTSPRKIGVEEPEQMVHPGALTILHEAMTSFVRTEPQRQVFLTTHSPTLLDLFEAEDVIWALFKNGITSSGHIRERQLKIIQERLFSTGELLLAEGLF